MSANLHRRGLLGLFATAPVAAAAGVTPGGARSSVIAGFRTSAMRMGRMSAASRGEISAAIQEYGPTEEKLAELKAVLRATTADARADQHPHTEPASAATGPIDERQARAIAAVALIFPPEIAAYRSFGAPMRRRLYAELLAKHGGLLSLPSRADPGLSRGQAAMASRQHSRGHR